MAEAKPCENCRSLNCPCCPPRLTPAEYIKQLQDKLDWREAQLAMDRPHND